MELTRNAVIGTAAGAVITVLAGIIITWLVTTSGQGMDAAERQRIETIIEEMTTLPDKRTYGEVLISLDKNVAIIANNMEHLTNAVRANTSDQNP